MGKDFAWMDEMSRTSEKARILSRFDRATLAHAFLVVLLLAIAVATIARGDDGTFARDDAKDMSSAQRPATGYGFQPLPNWARAAVMPALPQVLRPMGTKVAVLTTPPVPAHEPLTPPREAAPAPVAVAKPEPVAPAPAPAPNPTLIAVSPFLQWIKSNPQAAMAQARDQAASYQAGPGASGPVAAGNAGTPVVQPNGAPGLPGAATAEAPYWMPPLVDSSNLNAGDASSSTSSGSSAAIYSTPQR